MSSIIVIPIGRTPESLLTSLKDPLHDAFELPVEFRSADWLDPAPAFDASRNQYFSTRLIAKLLRQYPDHPGKILGVTSADLFVPVLTYVFGEAQLDGPAAIVSSYRLDDTIYGLPPNHTLLEHRLLKEAIHELGHTFGLVHCHDFECVMHSSTAVEEIDLKREVFCRDCGGLVSEKVRER